MDLRLERCLKVTILALVSLFSCTSPSQSITAPVTTLPAAITIRPPQSTSSPGISSPTTPEGGKAAFFGIVFASNRDGEYFDIYRMTSDGQNVERLTVTPDNDEISVRVSPDGRSILFSRGASRIEREIYLLDVASKAITQLTDSPTYDLASAWSPDSSRIAFISDREGGYYRLYLMNPDGSEQQHVPLETDPERDVTSVSWAPDGQHLVLGTSQHLVHAEKPLSDTVFIVHLPTLQVIPLMNKEYGDCFHPDWSPDGEWIAMVCTKGVSVGDLGEIYIVRPDGTDWRQVTRKPADFNPCLSPQDTWVFYVREPRWSPDGKEIVYAARINGPWNIYIIGADGKNNRRLTSHNAVDWDLSVYPLP